MSRSENVITVSKVTKDFVLPHEKTQSLKRAFTELMRPRKRGKDIQRTLDDVSFDVRQGEFFGIVGRNGSGKSTMLKVLAGIYRPTLGTTEVKGKLVPFIELGVGFNPELTGRENVYLNGALLGFSKAEIDKQYDEIVSFAELEQFMDQKLKNYSSGMQVRLAFSMAIRAEADILLIDEVLAVGDAAFQQKCLNYFYKLKKDKKTVVFISHDMDAIEQFCDRAIMIDRSKMVFEGTAHDVANRYRKMFSDENDAKAQDEATGEGRWGDGRASFKSFKLKKTKEIIDISLDIAYDETIDPKDLVCGFSIVGNAQRLVGTNTHIQGVNLAQYAEAGKPGRLKLTWTIPNLFSNGEYSVTLGLETPGQGQTHDWIEEALQFSILKEFMTHHIVEPEVKVTIG